MDARRFFYVCAGILLLVIAYSIGTSKADAQGGGQFAGIASLEGGNYGGPALVAIASNGDVFARAAVPGSDWVNNAWSCQLSWKSYCQGGESSWQYMGNVAGGTVPTEAQSWSGLKQGYKK